MVITALLLHTYTFELDPPTYQLAENRQLPIEDDVASRPSEQFRLKIVDKRH